MTGTGVVSVRLQRSLLGTFRAAVERQGITMHEAARRMLGRLPSLMEDELASLEEPPQEFDAPRVSLYVGWDCIDVLAAVTQDGKLTNSTIFRRLLYGLLVTRKLEFVQQQDHWILRLAVQKNHKKAVSTDLRA